MLDLLVIGAGMAGMTAARRCAAGGWSVAIVDALPYGGTCALRGCDPKKILRRGAEIVDAASLMSTRGIAPAGVQIDWKALMAHKRGFTEPVPDRMEAGLRAAGVTTLHGKARFTGPGAVAIDSTAVQARRILIATGARPVTLTFPGAEHLIDSTAFLELETLPRRIVFVGGGFISFEFAHIVARAGVEATIIEHGDRPLKAFDGDLVARLVARSAEAGIRVICNADVTSVTREDGRLAVNIRDAEATRALAADLVVHGAGRVAALDDLDLQAAGIVAGPRGVAVHPHLESTADSRVWAAGDSADTAGLPLTPVAVIEGKVAASNLLKQARRTPDYRGTPSVVFSIPELAAVGQTEEQARAEGKRIDVRFNDTGNWFSNYRVGERTAAAKVIVNRDDDTIFGAHLLGPEYAELINLFAVAIREGLTTRQLRQMISAYPTVGSDLASML